MKFPRSVKVSVKAAPQGGHTFEVVCKGAFDVLVSGHCDGTKGDARREAWLACESIGLVTDE